MKTAAQTIHEHLQQIEREELEDYSRAGRFPFINKSIFQTKKDGVPERIPEKKTVPKGRGISALNAVLTTSLGPRKKAYVNSQAYSTLRTRDHSAPKTVENYSKTHGGDPRVNKFRLSSTLCNANVSKTHQVPFKNGQKGLNVKKRAKSSNHEEIWSFLQEKPKDPDPRTNLYEYIEKQEEQKRADYYSAHEERMARVDNSMNEIEKRMTEILMAEMTFVKPKKDSIVQKKDGDQQLKEFEIQRKENEKVKQHLEMEEMMNKIKDAAKLRHETGSNNPQIFMEDIDNEPRTPKGELKVTPRHTFRVNFPKIRTKNAEPDLPVREETFLTQLERLHEQKERELFIRQGGKFVEEEEDSPIKSNFFPSTRAMESSNQERNEEEGEGEPTNSRAGSVTDEFFYERLDNMVSNERKNLKIYDEMKLIEINSLAPQKIDSRVDMLLVKMKIQEAKIKEQKRYERLFSTFKLHHNKDGWMENHEKELVNTHFYTSFTHEAKVGNLLLIPFPKFCINRVFYLFNYKVPSEKYCAALCVFLADNSSRLSHVAFENNSMTDQMTSDVAESLFFKKGSNTIKSLRMQKNFWDKLFAEKLCKSIQTKKLTGLTHLSLSKGSGAKNPLLFYEIFKSLRDGTTNLQCLHIGDALFGNKAFEMLCKYLEVKARHLKKIHFDNFVFEEGEQVEKLFSVFCQSSPNLKDLRVTNLHAPDPLKGQANPKGTEAQSKEDIRLLESLRHMFHLDLENSDIPLSILQGIASSLIEEKRKENRLKMAIQSIHLPVKEGGFTTWLLPMIKEVGIKRFYHVPLISDGANLEYLEEKDLQIRGPRQRMPVLDFEWQEDLFSLRYREKTPFWGYTGQSRTAPNDNENDEERSPPSNVKNIILYRIDDQDLDQERDWHWGFNCWICERWRKVKVKCRYQDGYSKDRTMSFQSSPSKSLSGDPGSPRNYETGTPENQNESDSFSSSSDDEGGLSNQDSKEELIRRVSHRRSSVGMGLGNCFSRCVFFANKRKPMSFSYSDKSYELVSYLPPGLVSFSIEMLFDNSPYPFVLTEGSLLVKPREIDPPNPVVDEEKDKPKKEFKYAESVFKNYVQESNEVYKKMLECDLRSSKFSSLFRKKGDLQILIEFMERKLLYKTVYWIFIQLVSQSSWPMLSEKVLSSFLGSCKVTDNYLTLKNIEQIYVSTAKKEKEEIPSNQPSVDIPKNFYRYQFLEIIIRLSLAKYIDSHRLALATEAVERFLIQDLLPCIPSLETILNQRKDKIHTDNVSKLLETNLPFIMKIANKYKQPDGSVPIRAMKLMIKDTSLKLTEQEINLLATHSKMWVISEKKEQDKIKNLAFVEFLEFVVRMGEFIFQKEAAIGPDFYQSTLKVLEALFAPLKVKPMPAKGIK